MLVREVMSRDPVTVTPDTTVQGALALLAARAVTALPVVAGGVVTGVVSEADLIRDRLPHDPRAHAIPAVDDRAPSRTVAEVMTTHPVTVAPDADLTAAIDLLTSTTVKSLPVVDRRQRLLGVLSRSDIVGVLARSDSDLQREVDQLLHDSGLEGWLVEVVDGSVTLVGPPGARDEMLATLLAETVHGVLGVTTRTEGDR